MSSVGAHRSACVLILENLANDVSADQRWADHAIEELKELMRLEICEIRVPGLWPFRPLRENMIRKIVLLKTRVLATIEHVREFREYLIREGRMLPMSSGSTDKSPGTAEMESLPPINLNSALAKTKMELRVRWNIARSRAVPGLLE